MIIYEQDDQLVVIRQTDHGLLAGFLAREWGNEEYTRPEPFAAPFRCWAPYFVPCIDKRRTSKS